jgi:hypothetical protein
MLWSWRESNPRPNEEATGFLHAYPRLNFRAPAGSGPPTSTLAPLISPKLQSKTSTSPDLLAPPVRAASWQQHPGDVLSRRLASGLSCNLLDSVTQQERNYFRQLWF